MRSGRKEDTNDGEYGGEEEEVVGEDWSKVEAFVASSWRHDWIGWVARGGRGAVNVRIATCYEQSRAGESE